jgi:hypothetical protein
LSVCHVCGWSDWLVQNEMLLLWAIFFGRLFHLDKNKIASVHFVLWISQSCHREHSLAVISVTKNKKFDYLIFRFIETIPCI